MMTDLTLTLLIVWVMAWTGVSLYYVVETRKVLRKTRITVDLLKQKMEQK